jgi:hypothetical protein
MTKGLLRTATALAVGLVATVVAAQPVAVPGPWTGIPLEPNGWTAFSGSADTWVFYRLPVLRPASAFPRIWVRYEYPAMQTSTYPPYRSSVELVEIDCAGDRSRNLQQDTFPQNNMDGGAGLSINAPGAWSYDIPGTVGEALHKVVCR